MPGNGAASVLAIPSFTGGVCRLDAARPDDGRQAEMAEAVRQPTRGWDLSAGSLASVLAGGLERAGTAAPAERPGTLGGSAQGGAGLALERFQKFCSRRRQSAKTDFMANADGVDSRPRLRDFLNCSRLAQHRPLRSANLGMDLKAKPRVGSQPREFERRCFHRAERFRPEAEKHQVRCRLPGWILPLLAQVRWHGLESGSAIRNPIPSARR